MRLIDDAARMSYENWNRGGRDEEAPGARPVLNTDVEAFRAFREGRAKSLPDPFQVWCFPELITNLAGKSVLCLASGGGQHSVVFGLLGAQVSVLDISEVQLERDRLAAAHYGYEVTTVQGDMRDLSAFADASFEVICQTISLIFVPDLRPVYQEVFRVLKPGGLYESAHCNPSVWGAELVNSTAGWDGVGYRISESTRSKVIRRTPDGVETFGPGEPIGEYVHSLSEIFNGLLESGLTIQAVSEDTDETPCFDGPLEPGSDLHKKSILSLCVSVLARKPAAP